MFYVFGLCSKVDIVSVFVFVDCFVNVLLGFKEGLILVVEFVDMGVWWISVGGVLVNVVVDVVIKVG